MEKWNHWLLFLGRLCISLIFVGSAFGKVFNFETTMDMVPMKALAPLILIVAIVFEFVGGMSILLGYKTRIGVTLLLLFLVPASLLFHNFWVLEGGASRLQMQMFLKNLSMFGGLLYVLVAGPGKYSLDEKLKAEQDASA